MSVHNRKHIEFCPCCVPCPDCPEDYEKIENFKNIGLVIYNRMPDIKKENQKCVRIASATKSIVVQNTSDAAITSADLLRELEKRNMACPRCRQIVELAHKLLQKVPALNKKASMSICDRCKFKDPCSHCKEYTRKFFQSYERIKYKEQITEWENKMKKMAEASFQEWFGRRPQRVESELRRDQLLHREHVPVERILDTHESIQGSHVQMLRKQMKNGAKAEREYTIDEITEAEPELRINQLLRRKYTTVERELDISDLVQSLEKQHSEHKLPLISTKSSRNTDVGEFLSTKKLATQTTQFEDIASSKKNVSNESVFTFDKISSQSWPKLQKQSRHAYASEKYKEYIDDQSAQKHAKDRIESEKTTNQEKFVSDIKNERKLEDSSWLMKPRSTKKSLKFPKVKESQQDFTFSFPGKLEKPRKVVRHKSSSELIKETHDMLQVKSEEIKKKREEKRLLLAQKNEAKLLAREEKARLDKEKQIETENKKRAEDERILLKTIEFALEKEAQKQDKSQIEESFEDQKLKSDDLKSEEEEPKLQGESREKKSSQTTGDLDQKENAKPGKITELKEKPKELQKDKYGKGSARINENEGKKKARTIVKKDKENALVEEDVEEKSKKVKKETWKIQNEKRKDKNLDVKIGKGIQNVPKEKHERGLADMLKGKNLFKPRDVTQLARKRVVVQPTPPKSPKEKKSHKPKVQKFKMRRPSVDLNPLVVKFKRSLGTPGYKYKGKTIRNILEVHEAKHKVIKEPTCPFCLNSDLELDFELRKTRAYANEYIKGKNIIDGSRAQAEKEVEKKPLLFHKIYAIPVADLATENDKSQKKAELTNRASAASSAKMKTEPDKTSEITGVTRYNLSDRSFIEKGWTMLPTEKVMRKMNVYRMRPAKPEFDWFKRNKNKQKMFYDTGEPLAQLDDDDRCRWYYRNGRVALDYYNAEELNAQQRFIIYSNGEPDENGRPRPYIVLAMFDYLGNGVVFDHGGKIRLKYNQTEGVVLDKNIGPVSHWKWHTLNDPPVLQQVMIDTQLAHKDPNIIEMGQGEIAQNISRPVHEDMVAIEFDNFIKEKSKKLTQTFKPFQIRMKAMKINEHFSLKVLDQASVYLIYRDGTTNIKLNIGMLLDHKEIVDTDTAEVGDVSSNLERFPARTDSLARIQNSVARAKHLERSSTDHERRLRPPEPCASADKLTAAASRPLRPPLRAANSISSLTDTTKSCCNIRKPASFNVYYCTT